MLVRNFSFVTKAVVIYNDKYLLLKKSESEIKTTKINKYIKWDLPGGAVQFFEKNCDGLKREIYEETQLDVDIIKPIGVYDAIKPNVHLVVITYLCICNSDQVVLSDEHDEYLWLSGSDIDKIDIPVWLKKYFYVAIEEYKNMKK